MSWRASMKSKQPGGSAHRPSLAAGVALQVGPPFVALVLGGIWLFHLSTQAALGAAIVAIGICVTYGAALRAVLARDREIEMIQNERRLEAEVEAHKKELELASHRLDVRLRELSLLFEITRSITSTLDLGELIKLLTETVGVALGFQEFAVLLQDEGTGELKVAATYGFPKQTDPETMRVGVEAVGLAAERAEIVLVNDVGQKAGYLAHAGRPTFGSFLAVPLKYNGRLVGVMSFSRPTVHAFAPDDVKLLAAIANQAAMAIVNARLHQKTVELSLTDPLTNVANRRHLFQKLEMESSRAQRFGTELSLLMIDIDHFKLYNDRHGHLAGDDVLRAVGGVLMRNVRRIDTVARYGGEEFVVILPQIRRHEAVLVGEKLRRTISQLGFTSSNGQRESVTISIGVAHSPGDARETRELIARADAALYAAKNGGRNRLVVYTHRRPSGSQRTEALATPKV